MNKNAKLIDIVARLDEAAAEDERLRELAKTAKAILLADSEAMAELLGGYLAKTNESLQPGSFTPVPPIHKPVTPNSSDKQEAIAILEKLLEKVQ
jgi:hypothetical protein